MTPDAMDAGRSLCAGARRPAVRNGSAAEEVRTEHTARDAEHQGMYPCRGDRGLVRVAYVTYPSSQKGAPVVVRIRRRVRPAAAGADPWRMVLHSAAP